MYTLFALIGANILLFLFPAEKLELTVAGFREGEIFQVVTAMFLHADFWHLLFNMWTLYIFGALIAPVLGMNRFLILYFVSGIAGNLLWLAASWNFNHALIGASGAVMGVILAAAMMVPDVRMYLLFIPFPIKLKTMAIVFILIQVFSQINVGISSGIAYTAHIGGFIGGYIVMRFFYRRYVQWDPLAFLSGGNGPRRHGSSGPRRPSPPPGWSVRDNSYAPPPPPPSGPVTQKELDALLDKVSAGGINSLSEAELERLRLAREQMRGKH